MAGLVPAIHALLCGEKDLDGRDKRGHDVLAMWVSLLGGATSPAVTMGD
jgi:hypothetical protein